MKKLLTATAIAALMAGTAWSQVTTPTPMPTTTNADMNARGDATGFVQFQETEEILAADIIGRPIYNRADEVLGTVNNLAITQDGHITVAIMSVGGFLGIGARNVAIAFDAIELTVDEDGDIRWVFDATTEQVAAAAEFETLAQRDLEPVINPPPPTPVTPIPVTPPPVTPTPMAPTPVTPAPAPMTPPPTEPPAPFAPAPTQTPVTPTPTPAPTPAMPAPTPTPTSAPTPAPVPGQPTPVTPPTPAPPTPGGA